MSQRSRQRGKGASPLSPFANLQQCADAETSMCSGPSRGYDSPDALTPTSSAANLQDLGIVPQTIFFSVLSADEMLNQARSRLQGSSTPSGGTLSRRVSTASSDAASGRPAAGRRTSAGQAPVDDLRRRLALGAHQVGGGAASPSMHSLQEDGEGLEAGAAAGATPRAATPTGAAGERLDLHRTVSQTSTAASEATTATSTTSTVSGAAAAAGSSKPRSRVRLNAVEVARAVPAVAEDSTNAMGLFDVEARYRASAGDADAASVMQDVVSQSPTQFKRSVSGRQVPRPPQRFVSTYGAPPFLVSKGLCGD